MREVSIYFDAQKLDLFGDEAITLVKKATDYKDLAKVYTDFTQSFTVPASHRNNRALKHYYDIGVSNGYGQSVAIDGWIEVDTLTIRVGTFIIEGCKMKNGLPTSYTLMFYGAIKSLKDNLGEDKLSDLDLSTYDHAHSFANVQTGVSGEGLSSGAIYYPLISPVRKWFYNSANANHESNNIAYHTGHSSNEHGINYYELKPALQLAKIIDAIEADYGFTFTSTFLASAAFTDAFMWLHRNEGYMPNLAQDITVSVTGSFLQHTWNNTNKTLTVLYDCTLQISASGASGSALVFEVYKNGLLFIRGYEDPILQYYIDVLEDDVIEFRFATISPTIENTATLTITYYDGVYTTAGGAQLLAFDAPQVFYYSYIYTAQVMPDMKIYDFLVGLIKTFNLVLYPNADGFICEPYEDWIAAGNVVDINRFVNIGESELNKARVYKQIEFAHAEPGTVAGKLYKDTFGTAYGDVKVEFDYNDADTFTVQTPFELPIFERLFDEKDGSTTQILISACIEDNTAEPSPYLGKPFILYYVDKPTGLTKPFNLLNAAGADSSTSAYHRFSTSNESSLSASTLSLAFGASIDPYFGATVERGLYKEYYQDQINDTYNSRTREVYIEAILPLTTILQTQMNDTITFGGNNYKIEEMKINLNTGETKFKLINKV